MTEARRSRIPYYPGIQRIVSSDYFTSCTVLVAHNGFPFDFVFLVAEVKCCKLDETFDSINIYFADTLYDARRVNLYTYHNM